MNGIINNQNDKVIYLGLAMSRAISAGAYSAGWFGTKVPVYRFVGDKEKLTICA